MQLKFGKYKGQEVSEIAKTDDGVAYLDWLRNSTDINDAKFGQANRILVSEINRCLDGKTIYVKEKPKKSFNKPQTGSNNAITASRSDFEAKVLSDLALIKKHLGISTETVKDEEGLPF